MKTVPLPAEYKNGATRLLVEHLNDLPRGIWFRTMRTAAPSPEST
jgi:hypothetical protein